MNGQSDGSDNYISIFALMLVLRDKDSIICHFLLRLCTAVECDSSDAAEVPNGNQRHQQWDRTHELSIELRTTCIWILIFSADARVVAAFVFWHGGIRVSE